MRDRKETVSARAGMRETAGTSASVETTAAAATTGGPVSYAPPAASRWRRNGVKVKGVFINLEFFLCLTISGLIALIPGIILTVVGFKVTCFDGETCQPNPLMIVGPIVIGVAALVFVGGVTAYCVLGQKAKQARQCAMQQSVPNGGGQSSSSSSSLAASRNQPSSSGGPSRTNYGFEPEMSMGKPAAPPSYDEIVGRY